MENRAAADLQSARTRCELAEYLGIRTREEELSFTVQMRDETRQYGRIQLGVDIVDDDGKVLTSFTFNLFQRRETERRRNHFGLAGAEHMADLSSLCPENQIVPMWTLAGEPCPPVSRSRLSIPFSVVFFHLRHVLSLFKPSLATVAQINPGESLTAKLPVNRSE